MLPTNGYTTDEMVAQGMLEEGLAFKVFRSTIRQVCISIIAAKEIAGTLTASEKLFRTDLGKDSTSSGVDQVLAMIKQDASNRWVNRGIWMSSADVTTIVNAAWANILKKYA